MKPVWVRVALVLAAVSGFAATIGTFVSFMAGGLLLPFLLLASLWFAAGMWALMSQADARDRAVSQPWSVLRPYDPTWDEQQNIVNGLKPIEWRDPEVK